MHMVGQGIDNRTGLKCTWTGEGIVPEIALRGRILAQPWAPWGSRCVMECAVSEQVHNHFRKYEVEYLQFAFRWMNNLLMRELPLRCTIRLWDTYQVRWTKTSQPPGFLP